MSQIKTITIIGSGNVATNLALLFFKNNFSINQIYSRNITNAQKLANKVNSNATDKLSEINNNSDIYILSVKDDIYKAIIDKIKIKKDSIIVHTSGSVNINIFENKFKHYGVFYPLQTFTKDKIIGFTKIPICIEANTDETQKTLTNFARNFSDKIQLINSEQRKMLHISAIFACNFTNHMLDIAYRICEKENIDPQILQPLITETIEKTKINLPKNNQTGPAIRNDKKTISEHIDTLNKIFIDKDLKNIPKLYSFVSQNIFDINKNKN